MFEGWSVTRARVARSSRESCLSAVAVRRTVVFILAAVVGGGSVLPVAAQTPVQAGFRDFSFGSTANSTPTGEKPESKLWWNDGIWWGSLFSAGSNTYRIHRFNVATQSWTDTGTTLDSRPGSKADVLWDGASGKLYVVSHVFSSSGSTTSSSWGRLYRLSYSNSTKLYTLDSGFPVDVTRGKGEALTIAKDGNGRLW